MARFYDLREKISRSSLDLIGLQNTLVFTYYLFAVLESFSWTIQGIFTFDFVCISRTTTRCGLFASNRLLFMCHPVALRWSEAECMNGALDSGTSLSFLLASFGYVTATSVNGPNRAVPEGVT